MFPPRPCVSLSFHIPLLLQLVIPRRNDYPTRLDSTHSDFSLLHLSPCECTFHLFDCGTTKNHNPFGGSLIWYVMASPHHQIRERPMIPPRPERKSKRSTVAQLIIAVHGFAGYDSCRCSWLAWSRIIIFGPCSAQTACHPGSQ